MKVTLVRRWGPYRAGRTVEVDNVQGTWLVQHNYATAADVAAPAQVAVAEGAHGADPLAGGDATRLRPKVSKGTDPADPARVRPVTGAPPAAYRAGYDAEARKREGEAGRNAPAAHPAEDAPVEGKPARRKGRASS